MRGHLRTELHGYMNETRLPPAAGDAHPITGASLDARIAAGRRTLEGNP
jgi:hypothetical protein